MEGWLARAGGVASKIFENHWKSSQNLQKSFLFFIFRENLEEIQPIAPRAVSGRLGPAQAGSAQLVFFEKSAAIRGPQKMIPGHWPKSKNFIVGMDGLEVADCGYFLIAFRSEFSSTEWKF